MVNEIWAAINALSPVQLIKSGALRQAKQDVNGYPSVVCPVCGNGAGVTGTGLSFNQKGGVFWAHCFKCHRNFNNVNLLEIVFGSKGKAASWFEREFPAGVELKIDSAQSMKHNETQNNLKDYSNFYKFSQSRLAEFIASRGGKFRGLTLADLQSVGAGITLPNAQDKNYWLVLPYSKHKFFKREVDGEGKKFIGGGKEIYNPFGAFDGKSAVFAVEGEIDCLSIYKAGFKAVAVGGVDNFSNLPEWLVALKLDYSPKIILLPDSDVVGKIQGKKGYEKMLAAGYDATLNFLSDEGIDANGILTQRGVFALQKRLHEILKGEI